MDTFKLNKKWVISSLPNRPKKSNKGSFGKVLIIAGSENYPGAAYLSCAGAYRVGAGLVTLVTTSEVKIIVSEKLPEVTFLSFHKVYDELSKYDVLILGPGLGQSPKITKYIEKLLEKKLPKLVIDGDGLNILSKIDNWWKRLNGEVVLTPHPGEFSRLTGLTIDQIQSDRKSIAKRFANKWRKILILKGANSIIVSSKGEVRVSSFANPALATAGTGDVLSGIIAGFMAQGLSCFEAACLGVYIHGLAGELLKEKIGEAGLIASDLLPLLPKLIKKLKS